MESVSREDALRAAADLVPVLKERAARTEQLRQILPETVKDLIASGLIRIGNPRRYGGNGLEVDVAYEVAWELGRGCGSTGWCYGLWTIHNWWIGHFSERAQDDLFATGPDTVFSSGLNPARGKAEPVSGGFRVSGRWSFSSGSDVASWVMVATPGAGPGTLMWYLLPRSDVEIVDTWFASGMRGSGSNDVVVEDVFVPAYRALDPNRAGDGDWTGWELHRRLSYRVPLRAMTGWDLSAPVVGIAQGAVDEFTARVRGSSTPGRTAESSALQLRLAEASAEVDAARALQMHDVRELLGMAARGESPSDADRARYRRDKAFVAKLCVQAVNRLFEGSGARAVMDSEPIQRFHRDAHAASHHAALTWDVWAEQFGRQALGLRPA
ncbi:MAG TPA: acyl-CoA dehydrogenase family protein [Candidatus Acidoferrum sp.]|nr:acyl-CoA dehydrogenase family protein [Candidatus Acidoferrum sp.]